MNERRSLGPWFAFTVHFSFACLKKIHCFNQACLLKKDMVKVKEVWEQITKSDKRRKEGQLGDVAPTGNAARPQRAP